MTGSPQHEPGQEAKPLLLDASALTAFLRREPGWEVVAEALTDSACLISAVQLVEIEGKLVSDGSMTADKVRAELALLGHVLATLPFSPRPPTPPASITPGAGRTTSAWGTPCVWESPRRWGPMC